VCRGESIGWLLGVVGSVVSSFFDGERCDMIVCSHSCVATFGLLEVRLFFCETLIYTKTEKKKEKKSEGRVRGISHVHTDVEKSGKDSEGRILLPGTVALWQIHKC
jgi:hypothetical protein